jgi:hypothetical protein
MRSTLTRLYFTICAKNYLVTARQCLQSLMVHHPDASCALVLCDQVSQGYEPSAEAFRVCLAKDIASPAFELNTLRYDVLELSTSIKAKAFSYFFDEGYDEVVFLDPDLYFFSRLDEIDASFEAGAKAILTPHVILPHLLGLQASQAILRDGTFNLGFLALSKCDDVDNFLAWWGARLDEACLVATELGMFTDQKWCDLLPSFVEASVVLRHPGYNVAYWNLHERCFSLMSGATQTDSSEANMLVNSSPLRFVHFSGVGGVKEGAASKHAPHLSVDDFPLFGLLLDTYRRKLSDTSIRNSRSYFCDYDTDRSGDPIPRPVRELFREELLLKLDIATMSREATIDLMIAYALEPECRIPQDAPWVITRFMHRLWRSRPDLQAIFDLHDQIGRVGFGNWFGRAATAELNLPARYHDTSTKAFALMQPSMFVATVGAFVKRIVRHFRRDLRK